MPVKHIPEGYHAITPYLVVENADRLIEFVQKVFDAQLVFKMENNEGKIGHAEVEIGDSHLMLAEASDEWKAMQTMLHLYVEDTDAIYKKALEAGAISLKEPLDQPYGDRNASVKDPFGNIWGIATRIEDVSEEETIRRMSSEKSAEVNANAA